jgi:DNA replication and repair protein RecF
VVQLHHPGFAAAAQQLVEVGPPLRRSLTINDAPVSPSQYMQVLPVFALSDLDRELVTGAPETRRSYLDRLSYLLEPAHYDHLSTYRRVLRQRNVALSSPTVTEDEMDVWEERLATAADQVVARRLRTVQRLQKPFQQIYSDLRGESFPDIEISYRHEAWLDLSDPERAGENLHKQYQERYYMMRGRDCQAGFTTDGPHRHDLRLRVDGRSARDVLSAGQVKVAAAALRLAALARVEDHRSERCPVVVDDVDAELDRHVLSRLIDHLDDRRQLFLSSAHEEMLTGKVASASASLMLMRQGACELSAGENL